MRYADALNTFLEAAPSKTVFIVGTFPTRQNGWVLTIVRTVDRKIRKMKEFCKGAAWSAKKVGTTYVVSVADGASLVEALADFVDHQDVRAVHLSGIGATDEVTLRFFDPQTKEYVSETFREQMEISNLSGNIAEIEGNTVLHLHVTLGRNDYTALAGHLLDARIRGAGEFFVYPLETKLVKTKDDDTGLHLFDFSK
jgi:predicted DNA-binding protein with PD1-like motif